MDFRWMGRLVQVGAAVCLATMVAAATTAQAQVLTAVRVANGLARPLYLTMPPGDTDRLFILEQHTGNIRIFDRVGDTLLGTPFLTIAGVSTGNEQGLLGLAFHPDYGSNGYFYVNYTRASDSRTHIVRYEVSGDPNVADGGSALEILSFDQPQSNHNGGWMGFGPDGYLYVATGDGGSANDFGTGHVEPTGNAQDIEDNLLGKMLRLDIDGDDFPGDPDRNYAIPVTNPFVGVSGDDEIWAYGLRNPWRASFDASTGDLFIGDVGQFNREEIDVQPASSTGGENYGWRLREGTIATPSGGVGGAKPLGAIDPIYDYSHGGGTTQGFAVTGGYVYRGPIAALQGRYFFADFVTERVWSLIWDESSPAGFDGTNFSDFVDHTDSIITDTGTIDQIASFGEDPDGNLFVIDLGGEVFQITGAPQLGDTDHFMFYKVRGTKGAPRFAKFGPVTLADELGLEEYDVLKVAGLGLPADKNVEGVNDATTHLTEYKVKAVKGSPKFAKISDVEIVNQCNSVFVQVVKPASILVPTLKDLVSEPLPPDPNAHELDHFLCYKARVQSKLADGTPVSKLPRRMQVEVVDQFDGMTSRRYDLKRITKVCNPVDKSGTPLFLSGDNKGLPKTITPATIANPDDRLVCYKAVLARKTIAQNGCVPADPDDKGTSIEPPQAKHTKVLGAFINNQFGPEQLDSQREAELCIPSLRIGF